MTGKAYYVFVKDLNTEIYDLRSVYHLNIIKSLL